MLGARRRFEKALDAKGYTISFCDWSPLVDGDLAMEGGWILYLNETNCPLVGINQTEIMQQIDGLEPMQNDDEC